MDEIEHLKSHVEVLEERLSRLAGAFNVLLDELDMPVAKEIQLALAEDFGD